VGVTGGTIDVVAVAGTINQAAPLTAQTDEGNISFAAAGNIDLGIVDARLNASRTGSSLGSQSSWGSIALTASTGTITGSQARSVNGTNLYGNNAQLEAGTGIGSFGTGADKAIVTELDTVAAETTSSGGINLLEDTAIAVGNVAAIPVNVSTPDGTTTPASSPSTGISGLTTAGNGSIVLVTTNGALTLSNAVLAAGSGNILLEAQGTGSNVIDQGTITTGTGKHHDHGRGWRGTARRCHGDRGGRHHRGGLHRAASASSRTWPTWCRPTGATSPTLRWAISRSGRLTPA
jgi:hypothetical protein